MENLKKKLEEFTEQLAALKKDKPSEGDQLAAERHQARIDGLIAAIEEEVNAWQQRHKTVDLQFNVGGDVSALEETINISVYRIVQEALTNISKHSEATRVTIELAKQECDDTACLLLKIEDNGGGMDPGQRNRGLGLLGMRERIEAINGSFSIHSEPGKGLRLLARVPLPEYEAA